RINILMFAHLQKFISIRIFLTAAMIAASISCGSSSGETNSAPNTEQEIISITVGRSEGRDIPAYIQATGSLVADEISNVAPKVAGKVSDVAVNVGDFVRSGQVIAKLDDHDARLRLAQANASVKQSQAAVKQAEARLGLGPNGSFNASAIP